MQCDVVAFWLVGKLFRAMQLGTESSTEIQLTFHAGVLHHRVLHHRVVFPVVDNSELMGVVVQEGAAGFRMLAGAITQEQVRIDTACHAKVVLWAAGLKKVRASRQNASYFINASAAFSL